ncbi:MAG: hypothetical protein GYB68_05895 [Chloroflexi bacterium]|nr:hypothetical protein [Chloroflexota bacterium]
MIALNGRELPCAAPPTGAITTLEDALIWSCPGPLLEASQPLPSRLLDAALDDFGLFGEPNLVIETSVAELEGPPALGNFDQAVVGQGSLTVTPLHMAMVAAGLANRGRIPPLQLAQRLIAPDGEIIPLEVDGSPRGTISPSNADSIAGAMRRSVLFGASRPALLPQQAVYGHTGVAIAGPEGQENAWFIGFVRPEGRDVIAVAVLIEDAESAGIAAEIGGEALRIALQHP